MTKEDFRKMAKKKKITFWKIRNCSFCEQTIGYEIRGNDVYWNGTCDCCTGSGYEKRSWQDLANLYNMQSNKTAIDKMNKFWGFK